MSNDSEMDEETKLKLTKARDPRTSPNELEKLMEEYNEEIGRAAAENPSFSISRLVTLSNSANEYVRFWIALCSRTPPHILEKLSRDPSDIVQVGVAENPSTPHDTLRYLAKHGLTDVPLFLGGNPAAPEDVLDYLSRLEYPDNRSLELNFRSIIENNPSTPPHIMERVKGSTKALKEINAKSILGVMFPKDEADQKPTH